MYKDKKVIHIVCCGLNGEIGKDNKLLWNIPEELKYFKEQTLGHVILMGRKTYKSLPKPLDRRIVNVVTNKYPRLNEYSALEMYLDDCVISSNALNTDCIFVAGGGQLYETTSDIVDELWITQVKREYPDADTHYKQPEGFKKYCESDYELMWDSAALEYVPVRFTKWNRK